MFLGRREELAALEKRYRQKGFQFPVLYGRRRVGKSALIKEFIQNKKAVYYVATEQDENTQLEAFSEAVRAQLDSNLVGNFPSWEAAFLFFSERCRKERIILVIDEYPYLAKAYPAISSILQKYIDEYFSQTRLYLILCGSSMSFMEKQVLGYESPLYGRRTAQIRLEPMAYDEAVQFFPDWHWQERLYAYGICGGIPQYLEYFSKYEGLQDAVVEEFFETGGHLREETDILLKQELREPAFYNSILTAIARGRTRLIEIADAVGKSSNQILPYLNNLISLQIVEKILPVEETNAKKALYVIKDNLYRFFHFFVMGSDSILAVKTGEEFYHLRVEPLLPDYFGRIFEDICIAYLERQMRAGVIREAYIHRGHWWGSNPQTKQQEEIDVLFASEEAVLVGECKWRNEKAGLEVLHTLEQRGGLIQRNRSIRYVIFSKSGFEAALKKECGKRSDVTLIAGETLVDGVEIDENGKMTEKK